MTLVISCTVWFARGRHERLHLLVFGIPLGVDVEQRVRLLLDLAALHDQIELADEGREGARFRNLAELTLQRLADALVRVRTEDVVHTLRARLVGQIELLRETHVREHEDDLAALFAAQDFHVLGEIHLGTGERDAA